MRAQPSWRATAATFQWASRSSCSRASAWAAAGGGAAPYAAIGTLHLTSVEALQAALAKHGAEIMGDVPNYTDAQPVLQISEAKVG